MTTELSPWRILAYASRGSHRWAALWSFILPVLLAAQPDTLLRSIQLDEVVISAQAEGFDVAAFVAQVRTDTTFHKAFLQTRYHPHRLRGDLRVRIKGADDGATLYREARLERDGPRARQVIEVERESGRLRDRKGGFRYLTVEMYDDVFFPKGSFAADNSVARRKLEVSRGSRFEKYKSELKKFMFDPGSEIATVPFIGDKLALFDPHMAPFYDLRIWADERDGLPCWVFSAEARPEVKEGRTVIKTMDTWFDRDDGHVLARQYRIAHRSMVLDFDIRIAVENRLLDGVLLPMKVAYAGDWDIPFKQRELVRFDLEFTEWQVVH